MKDIHNSFLNEVLKSFDAAFSELIHISDAIGRVIASDVRAKFTLPHRDMSALNGYAVVIPSDSKPPYHLKIVGESTAGSPFLEELEAGCAVRVYCGVPIPIGSETVLSELDVQEKNGVIIVSDPVMKGQNICYKGVDFLENEPVLKEGSVLTVRDIALAASMHISWIPVNKKPTIGVFAVGDELAMLGDHCDDRKMVSSSSLAIASFIEACGARCVNLGVASDSVMSIEKLMGHAKGCDMVVTTGGVSVSANNLMKKTFDTKPKPVSTTVELSGSTKIIFGEKFGIKVLALPGNPISAQICATLFLRPIINQMVNRKQKFYKMANAVLDRNLDVNDKKMDYIFGKLVENDDKRLRIMPASSYDRLLMSALASSDCLMTVNEGCYDKDCSVPIMRFVCSVISG